MKLLIVDDNKYVVESVKRQLDWSVFDVDEVFGAYNVSQAKKIFTENEIDFLISDIDMPDEDGFALQQWLMDEEIPVLTLLLTSFSDFDYARKAVYYHCEDYVQKPLSTEVLESSFSKMFEKRMRQKREARMLEFGNNWLFKMSLVKSIFWRELLIDGHLSGARNIEKRMEDDFLDYKMDDHFLLAKVNIQTLAEDQGMGNGTLQFVCENILSELLSNKGASFESILFNGDREIVIVFSEKGPVDEMFVTQIVRQFSEVLEQFSHRSVNSFISESDVLVNLRTHIVNLDNIYLNNVLTSRQVILERLYEEQEETAYLDPEFENIRDVILKADQKAFEQYINTYFHRLKASGQVSYVQLVSLLADWEALVFFVLKEKNIPIHQFIESDRDLSLRDRADQSVESANRLILNEGNAIIEKIRYVSQTVTLVESIKEYVVNNLDSVSRTRISETFYISPNYLSKLFKKETGIHLSDFVQQERMEKAKSLLLTSQKTISEIAEEIGYPSFAHFSKQFKRFVGQTPNEYRKQITS